MQDVDEPANQKSGEDLAGLLMITSIRTNTGKIARLPHEVRDALNRRLDDGEGGEKLLEWLNGLSEVQEVLQSRFAGKPIVKQNLWAWRQGGYRDWVLRQDAMELAQRFANEAEGIEGQNPEDGVPGAEAAGRKPMTETIALWVTAQFGVASRYLLAAEGKQRWRLFRQMVTDVAKLRGGDLSLARLQIQEQRTNFQRAKLASAQTGRRAAKEPPANQEKRKADPSPSAAEFAELLKAFETAAGQGKSR